MKFSLCVLIATIEGPANCSDGDIRLYGSSLPNQGILQVCHNRAWGTVCGYNYDASDNNVACSQLGYTRYGTLVNHILYNYFIIL